MVDAFYLLFYTGEFYLAASRATRMEMYVGEWKPNASKEILEWVDNGLQALVDLSSGGDVFGSCTSTPA
jgi:hypothetical protein